MDEERQARIVPAAASPLSREVIEINGSVLDQFRAFLDHVPVGITFVKQGIVNYMNPAMLRLLGHDDAEAILGRPVLELIHPEDRGAVGQRIDAGQSEVLKPRATRCLRRDGTSVVIENTPRPFIFDGVPSQVTVSRDITEEAALEDARRETMHTLETFRRMVDSIRDYAIFQLDPNGLIRTWNAGAQAIKGYLASEVLGQHIAMFYPDCDKAVVNRQLELAAASGHAEEEGWRVRKDGTRFWANVVITALHDPKDGKLSGFVKVTRDLSERKRMEDAQAASLAEKTAMLQEIHHRVKNNLQMISSLLNLQARHIDDPNARAVFLATQGRVRSIALLHESLYQSSDLGRVDMREYIHKLVVVLRRAYGEETPLARVTTSVEHVFLPVDAAVPCGLIINELVSNALKHAFRGGNAPAENEIRVEMIREDESLVIVVSDNGSGFSALEPQENDKTMGLVLVRDLGGQLRGVVRFENAGGARCTVRFPMNHRSEAPK